MVQDSSVPNMLGAADSVPAADVYVEDTVGVGMGDQSGMQQRGMGQYETVTGGGDIPGVEPSQVNDHQDRKASEERVEGQAESPNRPQRTRRPNVKYSQEEYDLSKISAHTKQAGISGISVEQYKMKDRLVLRSPESWG